MTRSRSVARWARSLTRRESIREFSWLSANTQVEVGLSLLSSILIIRLMPESVAGQLFFAQAAVGIAFMVLDPRLEDAVQRFFPRQRAIGEEQGFFWRMVRIDLYVAVGAVALGILVIETGLFPASSVVNTSFVLLALLAGGASAAAGTVQAGFAVSGRLSELARWRTLVAIGSTTLAVGGLLFFGPIAYLGGLVVGSVAFYLIILMRCRALIPAPRSRTRSATPPGVWHFAVKSSLATSLAAGGDNAITTVAGLAGGADLVVLLKIAMAPGRFLLSLLSPVSAQLFPRLSEQAALSSAARVRGLCERATKWALPPVVVAVGLGWLLMPFALALVYGDQYRIAYLAAALFLTAIGLRALVVWSKVLPLAVGRPGLRLVVLSVEAVVLIGASAALPRAIPDQVLAVEALGAVALVLAATACVFWLLLIRWPGLIRADTDPSVSSSTDANVPKARD